MGICINMYNTPDNMATVYFYNADSADAILAFRASWKIVFDRYNIQEQKQIVIDAFKGIGWKAPELPEELKKSDAFYLDQGCQIKMPGWTKGRVASIADAGYAPAFPTDMGSTLAIQGAAVLADTMETNENHEIAFKFYHEIFRRRSKNFEQPFMPECHSCCLRLKTKSMHVMN